MTEMKACVQILGLRETQIQKGLTKGEKTVAPSLQGVAISGRGVQRKKKCGQPKITGGEGSKTGKPEKSNILGGTMWGTKR